MSKFSRIMLSVAALTPIALVIYGYAKAMLGNYFTNNPFNAILMTVGVVVLLYAFFRGIKYLRSLPVLGPGAADHPGL
jgi:hypothetical protein